MTSHFSADTLYSATQSAPNGSSVGLLAAGILAGFLFRKRGKSMRLIITKSAAVATITVALALFCRSTPADEKKHSVIPLNKIYSTSIQAEMEPFGMASQEQWKLISKIKQKSIHLGASNIYLAYGKNLDDALQNTLFQMTTGINLEYPINYDANAKRSRQLWMVAYFGVRGSAPAYWDIRSIRVREKSIRVVFRQDTVGGSADVHPYYYWIPVGELAKGTYALELFDEKNGDVVLMRRVEVPAEK